MKQRRDRRHKVLIRARLRGAGQAREVCILDLSAHGLLATSAQAPARGGIVELAAETPHGRRVLVGRVEWAKGRRFGLTLDERLDVSALLGGEVTLTPKRAAPSAQAARQQGRAYEFWAVAGAAMAASLLAAHLVAGQFSWASLANSAMAQANSTALRR